MSYISAIRQNDEVIVWERDEHGRDFRTYEAPYYFYVKDKIGEFTSMYGDRLRRYDFGSAPEFQRGRQDCISAGIEMFESDIPAELRILSEHYYKVKAPTLHVSFFDIEVDYDKEIGFSSVDNPYAPLNSVAIYHAWKKKYVVLAIPPNLAPHKKTDDKWMSGKAPQKFIDQMSEIAPYMEDIDLEIRFCANEKELLIYLLQEIEDSDLISGWNSDFFDVPYIGKRLEKIGKKYFRMLSFKLGKEPRWRTVEVMGNEQQTLDLSGRISSDYMVLFKKYEMEERPSYKLESIANEILPDLPKLEYEGTLAELYRDNFAYFVRYNIRDTEILHGLEDRLGYVETANQMYHLSTGLASHVTGTLKLAELATINYCHHELDNLIVNDVHVPDEDGQIQGAFVLLPQVGMHENISSVDLASLYPSGIRSNNISPETIVGQLQALEYEPLSAEHQQLAMNAYNVLKEKGKRKLADKGIPDLASFIRRATMLKNSKEGYAADLIAKNSDIEINFTTEDGETLTAPAKDFRKLFLHQKWGISGYGTVFNQNEQGIIPMILTDWYNQRRKYKKEMAKAKDAGDNIKATYYDKLQYVYKIKLNSFYGALTNKYFRFYDLRMGESTTATGRQILLHQCAEACKVLDGEYMLPNNVKVEVDLKHDYKILKWHYGYKPKDEMDPSSPGHSIVYGDTDSTYFTTNVNDPEDATFVGDSTGTLVNASFKGFMQNRFLCEPGFDDIMECEREVVSDRGIFVDKKRYILHLVDLDGWKCDKLKVMGLDTKKTTLPKEVSAKINGFVERLLKGEEWDVIAGDIVEYKDQLINSPNVMDIGLPKGVNKVEIYTMNLKNDATARLPGHVAASIFYNLCREKFEDKESIPIVSGMKIKVFYLTQKYGKFKSVAIPVDIERIPNWFLKEFKVDKQAHIDRLVDNPLQNIIKAIDKEVPTRQSLLVDDLLVF